MEWNGFPKSWHHINLWWVEFIPSAKPLREVEKCNRKSSSSMVMDLTPSLFGAFSACFILKKCLYLLNHACFWLFTLGPISRVKEKAHPNPSWFMSFTFSQVASDLPSSSRYRSLRYPASSDLCSGSAGESRAIFWPSPGSPRPDSPGFTQGTIHCKDVLGSTA